MEHWVQFKFSKGFSLIEMIIVIFIIAILSSVIMFGVSQYINKGKDSNIYANMVILIPAGEKYYEANGNSYTDFCNPNPDSASSINVIKNAIAQMPTNTNGACHGGEIDEPDDWETGFGSAGNPPGLCCDVNSIGNSWVACANEFSDPTRVYCVDSRGIKKSITGTTCEAILACNLDTCECL